MMKRDAHTKSILQMLTPDRLAYAIDPKARPKGVSAEAGGRHSGFVLRCPCHDDTHPSMSIDQGDDGRILIHCHAGCAQETIIEELQHRGLWPKPKPERSPSPVGHMANRNTGLPTQQDIERAQAVLFVAESDRLSNRLARLSEQDHVSIRRAQDAVTHQVASPQHKGLRGPLR